MKWILNYVSQMRHHIEQESIKLKSKVRERLKQRSDLNELEIQRKELLKQLQLAVKLGFHCRHFFYVLIT